MHQTKTKMSIKKDHLSFSDKTDYKKSLKELKMHFNVKWKQTKSSPVINMDNFDKLAILGNGAFGTVVSKSFFSSLLFQFAPFVFLEISSG